MDGLTCTVTLDERKAFHTIDRQLYVLLVTYLSGDATICLQILGLWLWFERWGCPNVVTKILASPISIVKALVDEAITCLKLINSQSNIILEETTFPLITNRTLEIVLSPLYFCVNRDTIYANVRNLVRKICLPALSDLYQRALSRQVMGQIHNIAQVNAALMSRPVLPASSLSQEHVEILSTPDNSLVNDRFRQTQLTPPLIQAESVLSAEQVGILPSHINSLVNCGFWQAPMMSPPIQAAPSFLANQTGVSSFPDNSLVHDDLEDTLEEVPACDRTMFLTFSKGYPVSEEEVHCHLTSLLGNCIEEIHMQEVRPGEQVLFATVVFLRVAFIDAILDGCQKVKHTINGKHVWMRKYVERNPGIRSH